MTPHFLRLAVAALGVLALVHETDGFHNVDRFTTIKDKFVDRAASKSLLATISAVRASNVQEAYYEQAVVDHHASTAQQKFWKQRYLVNQQFWGGKGYPVFFYNGGETRMSQGPMGLASHAGQLAQKHKALLVSLEHRYYGLSMPTPDLSVDNLRFLSSEQQMADVARFHGFLTEKLGLEGAKWVAFGGSYAGSLAAWEKLKYPQLFAGAVASSAPLLAKTDFFEYNEVVGRSLRYFGGDACYNRVREGVEGYRKLLDSGNATRSELQRLFPACHPIQNELDLSVFESEISYPIQNVVQYNDVSSFQVSDLCSYFANETSTPVELLSAFTLDNLSGPCIDSTFQGNADGMIEFLKNATIGTSSARQWFYQTCNEFGWFQTTTSAHSPFAALKSETADAIGFEICQRVFNMDAATVTENVRKTNARYGGLDITVENVTFVSGSIDPWSAMSATNTTHLKGRSSSVVYIEGTSHAADVYAPHASDIPALTAAYATIAANVAKYIGAQP